MGHSKRRFPIGLAVAAIVAAAALVVGCSKEKESKPAADVPAAQGSSASDGVRVFNTVPRFRLRDQTGAQFGSAELFGKVWIATFVFTRCEQTCPEQTKHLAKIHDELRGHPARDQIHFVSITVDPAHDTSEVLAAYAKQAGADPARWAFLTGAREDIWTLCDQGFKLPVADSNDPAVLITHSQNFVLVDRARRIRGHYDGLQASAHAKLKRDLKFVLGDPPGPIAARKTVPDDDRPGQKMFQPKELSDTPWLKERAQAQMKTLPKFKVFHDFKFVDRQPASGITFMNKVVDDAGKFYKGVHYDHGNGVAIADVDGDGLHDIYFVNQIGPNQLCRNAGGGKFEDITQPAGVAVGDRIGVTASFVDIDNDSDQDLFVTTVRGGNLLFENDGKGRFKDVSASSGLAYNGHSSSAVFFDYDRDGRVDLFLCNPGKYTTERVGAGGYYIGYVDGFEGHLKPERTERSILYHNEGGGRFVDVSEKVGLVDESWTGAASPIDANDDGWPDLYVLSMQGHDEYYENVEGKRFVRKSRELFPRTPWGAMGIKVFDFDNDGRMDIFITDMHTDMVDEVSVSRRYWYAEKMKMTESFDARFLATDGNHVAGNAFFRNEGNGKFREASDELNAENYWPWGLSVGDLNADGWDDAFVASSMNFPFRYGVNTVLLNNRGESFLDSEFVLGVEPRRDGRTSKLWFVLDCDGADRENPYGKGRTGKVEVWGALGTRSSVIFDLDNDGDLDIVTNDFNSEPMVLVSNLTERKPGIHWLSVNLVGTKSNRNGLGARVRVTAGGQTWTKVNDGQSGYLSQSVQPLYFGLGDRAKIDRIEVDWPSSDRQVVDGPLETNRLLTITEPQ
jgi:cytochrome oxidase Cu insertion factor (SCO1/SenC/PrrC family)